MRRIAWLFALLYACGGDKPVPIPPGAVIAPPDPPKKKGAMHKPSTPPTPPPVAKSPMEASFVDLAKGTPVTLENKACEVRAAFVVKGKITSDKDTLAVGDLLIAQGVGQTKIEGDGATAVIAIVEPEKCEQTGTPALVKKVVRGNTAADLKWAGGNMRARLDVENNPLAYMGRLEGTAAVAEHTHDTSWELLCAIEAQGTFTLAGTPQKLAAKQCVKVPPKTLHSWTPDANTKLVAIQLYSPAGPEQRFKALAAEARADASKSDAGAPPIVAKPDAGSAPVAKPDAGAAPSAKSADAGK